VIQLKEEDGDEGGTKYFTSQDDSEGKVITENLWQNR